MAHDRKLGDEWSHWDGDLSRLERNTETGKRVFLGFAIMSILLLDIAIAFIWYMIKPRMLEISRTIANVMEWAAIVAIIVLFLSFMLTVLSIITQKNLLIGFGRKKFSITFLTPFIIQLGEKFGISYDRMGNSFIKVSNSLIKTTRRHINNQKILILIPRCLTIAVQKEIKQLAQKYGCLIFTVPGGELARKIIARERPKAVIGVACERDLISGIRDVSSIPVIGVPNQRPEGPCKNTIVNFRDIEEAILHFLNYKTMPQPAAANHFAGH
ncbi:DUF116 domain-containing protein [candidate division KSB1 bacterium]|nr:DUF116 domain-containing protein [candidate division KSB1 bacterium]